MGGWVENVLPGLLYEQVPGHDIVMCQTSYGKIG